MTGVQTCALPICFPVTIEDDYKGIEQAMKLQRERSKEAGYGSNVTNWNQYVYENEMRELKNAKKMQKALTKL